MRISSLIFAFAFLGVSKAFALDFPNGFPRVDQTYGDFNDSTYHDGIDLPGSASGQYVISSIPNGILIYASPVFRTPYDYVCIKDPVAQKIYAFGHIAPTAAILSMSSGTVIPQGTIIGELEDFPGITTIDSHLSKVLHSLPEANHETIRYTHTT